MRSENQSNGPQFRWINLALESLWLVALVLVPLTFLPKNEIISELDIAYLELPKIALMRTVASLMAALVIADWLLKTPAPTLTFSRARLKWSRVAACAKAFYTWLRVRPTRWVTISVIGFGGVTLISTLLSPSVDVSLWGEVPGQGSYQGYSVLCYLVIFGVVSVKLRTQFQFQRLMTAGVTAGVLLAGYGMLQHYGYDPLNLINHIGAQRVTSTTGNAIFAGSAILLFFALSVMNATISLCRTEGLRNQSLNWLKWTSILTVQLLGLLFTLSRGPWVGTITALAVLILLTAIFAGRGSLIRAATVLLVTAVVTLAILAATGESAFFTTQVDDGASESESRFVSIGGEVISGNLSNRGQVWKGSLELILDRPWFDFETLSWPFIRPFIGYGPDMFRYTYLLVSVPDETLKLPFEPRHAHNYLVHQAVEQGYLGLLAAMAIFVSIFCTGIYLLFRRRNTYSESQKLILIGLLSIFAGRFVEQLVGLGWVSDFTVFWILLGAFCAFPSVSQANPAEVRSSTQRRSTRTPTAAANGSVRRGLQASEPQFLARLLMVLILCAGIAVLTWSKNFNYIQAGLLSADYLTFQQRGDFESGMKALDQAISLAPDVQFYYTLRADLYRAYLENPKAPVEPECTLQITTPYQECLNRQIYLNYEHGFNQRPLQYRGRRGLAEASLTLSALNNDAVLADEGIQLYKDVAAQMPYNWLGRDALAETFVEHDRPEEALAVLNESLAITGNTTNSARAFVLRGAIYQNQGLYGTAVTDFSNAIDVDPQYTEAYYRRGNVFMNLKQAQAAVNDFDETIKQEPSFDGAYAGRAAANTMLGNDTAAAIDVEQALTLGHDPADLERLIEAAKSLR